MRSAIAIALLSGCTFAPPDAIDPIEDAGFEEPIDERDAGPIRKDADAPLDGTPGEPDAAIENRAPVANAGDAQRVLVWDTVRVDGSRSIDPDGDPLSYVWTIAERPVDATGGFAPLPGAMTSTDAAPILFPDRAGSWVLRLEVDDGALISTATVTITVAAFAPIPPPDGVAPGEVIALALAGDRLFMGVKPHGGQLHDLRTNTSSAIPCAIGDKTNDIEIAASGEALYAVDDASDLVATDGQACRTIDLPNSPGKSKDIELVPDSEQFFVATDRDVFFWDGAQFVEFRNDAMGNDRKYRAIAIVSADRMWLGSDEAGGRDGAIATSIPPDPASPIVSFFPGDDKIYAIEAGLDQEVWLSSDLGIVRVFDTRTPTVAALFTTFPAPLTVPMRGIAFDPESGDVFFANQRGVARYKRDLDAIVAIPQGTSGLSAADVRAIAFDPASRSLFVGNQDGAFVARP